MDTCVPSPVAYLRARQRVAGQEFADRLADLVGAAQELVEIETTLRVAETQAGTHAPGGPPPRELAVEMLYGRLDCLRPYLPFATEQSADRAQEALTR